MRKILNIVFIAVFVILAFTIYWNYYNVYSEGDRVGKLLKVSLKGNIFKTYEAEMLQPGSKAGSTGFQNNFFYFSIPNDSLAKTFTDAQGKEITLHYVQYRNSLPWRGDNYNDRNADKGQYITTQLIKVANPSF